jgi:hypothetical protein
MERRAPAARDEDDEYAAVGKVSRARSWSCSCPAARIESARTHRRHDLLSPRPITRSISHSCGGSRRKMEGCA